MNDRAGPAYRDEVAAAYARLESLEAEARARAERESDSDDARLTALEAHARRWDRVRTTLALVLGLTTLLSMHISERFGSSVAVLLSSVVMVGVGVTLAWPSLSMRAAVRSTRVGHAAKKAAPSMTGVRVLATSASEGEGSAEASRATATKSVASQDSTEERTGSASSARADRERAR